jgi:hypothetical protein
MRTQKRCTRIDQAIRDWWWGNRLRRQLTSLDRATRADLNLSSEAAVVALTRNARRKPGQFQRMLRRLDLSEYPWLASPAYHRDLDRTCALCPTARRCARWLASSDRDGYRAFCPNAAELLATMSNQRMADGLER